MEEQKLVNNKKSVMSQMQSKIMEFFMKEGPLVFFMLVVCMFLTVFSWKMLEKNDLATERSIEIMKQCQEDQKAFFRELINEVKK